MHRRTLITAGVTTLGGLLFLGGCAVAPRPTPVERDYGLSHRLAIYNQTAAPVAGESSGAGREQNRAGGQGKTGR